MDADRIERVRRALRWLTAELEELDLLFQVAGGLAARAHGASRPLHDIGIEVPVMPLDRLVAYKARLDRPVDREDLAELRDEG